jgi:hypothetical protein
MTRYLTSVFLLLCSITIAGAQDVKIKKGVILLDKNPSFKIASVNESEDRFETYTYSDMSGAKVLVATPIRLLYEQMPFESRVFYDIHYQTTTPEGKKVVALNFIPISYKKRITKALATTGILETQEATAAAMAKMPEIMVFDEQRKKEIEAYNERRKELLANPAFAAYAKEMKKKDPNFPLKIEGQTINAGGNQIGWLRRNINPAHTLAYDITNLKNQKIGRIYYQAKTKKIMVESLFDNKSFAFQIAGDYDDTKLKEAVSRFIKYGYL